MSDHPEPDESARAHESELSGRDREKYRILSELARGGMGVVLRGHDRELGRDVAVKVLDPALADREEVRQRFIEEAQIGGQLQHPGIVPVYELGVMADARPWFAMKLIKGRTLADLLAARQSVEAERGKLLGIFESVCQTMAYAHSKGVIHRDLKPANVMVGAFGEVQVVDWGLAKVLGDPASERSPAPRESLMTVIETVRSKDESSGGSASIVGSVLGTPAYMPPEQAQGNIERLDARADVFALGAILCEILTGAAPYVAEEGQNVLDLAADAELGPALARLDGSSADDELKELCRRCLGPARGSRPKDAAEVAEAIHDHIVGNEERAHRAELAAAEQRLAAERASRRFQVTSMVAGLVLLVVAGAVGGSWWIDQQRERRAAELSRAFSEAQPEILQAYRDERYERALELASAAQRLVEAGEPTEELRQRAGDAVAQAEERLRAETERRAERQRLADFEAFLREMESSSANPLGDESVAVAYEEGFRAFGIVPEDPNLNEVLEPYRDTELGIRIARGFDNWAWILRNLQQGADRYRLQLLTGIGLDLDDDPIRADVRRALVERDEARLVDLAATLDLDRLPPETIHAIGLAFEDFGQSERSCQILSRGATLYPDDWLLNHSAAMANFYVGRGVLVARSDGRNNLRAAQFLRAAISMQPESTDLYLKLSDTLRQLGDYLGAWEADQVFIRLAAPGTWNPSAVAYDTWLLGLWDDSARFQAMHRESAPRGASSFAWGLTAEVYGGMRSLESALTELESFDSRGVKEAEELAAAHATILTVVPEGEEPDPERALEFSAEVDRGDSDEFWFGQALAYARLGRGKDVLRMMERTEKHTRTSGLNFTTEATHELLRAVGHSLVGDGDRAAYHLHRAETARAILAFGREDGWADSWMEMVFEQFEPLID